MFLVLTALPGSPARAEDEETNETTEVEFAVAEGSGSGSFGCGQQTRLRYARAAVQIRHSEHPVTDPRGQGITLLAGVAVDGTRVTPIDPPTDENLGRGLGETWFEGRVGGQVRLGYRHRWVGLEGGMGFGAYVGDETSIYPLPQFEVSVGPRDLAYVVGGIGPSQLTSQLDFSYPFVGFGCVPTHGLELEARWGRQYRNYTAGAERLDVIWRLRMNEKWAFRGGLAIGEFGGDSSFAREASIGLVFVP